MTMQESQFNDHCSGNTGGAARTPAPLPVCCGTGCVVCVLDYPEQFLDPQSQDSDQNSDMMAMLAAFEEAEAAIANPDSAT